MFPSRKERALIVIKHCSEDASFWGFHGDVFPATFKSCSIKVLQRLLELGLRPHPLQEGQRTSVHDLGATASIEWVNQLKAIYPEAPDYLYQSRLPLELYVKRVLTDGAPPKQQVIEALSSSGVLRCKHNNGGGVLWWLSQYKVKIISVLCLGSLFLG